MKAVAHYVRLLLLAVTTLTTLTLNHRQVVRYRATAPVETPVARRAAPTVVKERVSLVATFVADVPVPAPPVLLLPPDPLGGWLAAAPRPLRALRTVARALVPRAGPAVCAALLGRAVSPQAP